MIEDLIRVSNKLGTDYVSRNKYQQNGKYSATPFLSNFGTWKNVLKVAGLRTEIVKGDLIRVSDDELISDINRVANLLFKKSITTSEYAEHGKYKVQTVLSRFKNWDKALKIANLIPTGFTRKIVERDLLQEIERIWIKLGRQPTSSDIRAGVSKYSLNTFSRRFGGWRNSLQAFIDYIKDNDCIFDEDDIIETPYSNIKKEAVKSIDFTDE